MSTREQRVVKAANIPDEIANKDISTFKVGWRLCGLKIEEYIFDPSFASVHDGKGTPAIKVKSASEPMLCRGRMRNMRPWVAHYFYSHREKCWKLVGYRRHEDGGGSSWLVHCPKRYRKNGESEFCTMVEYQERKHRNCFYRKPAMAVRAALQGIECYWYQHVPHALWRL